MLDLILAQTVFKVHHKQQKLLVSGKEIRYYIFFQVYVHSIDTVTMEMTEDFITTASGSSNPYNILIQLGDRELIQGKFTHFTAYSKTGLKGHSKRRPKIVFQDSLLLNAGQKYCRMLQWSILQYFRPAFSLHLSFRPLFCLFLSGRLFLKNGKRKTLI